VLRIVRVRVLIAALLVPGCGGKHSGNPLGSSSPIPVGYPSAQGGFAGEASADDTPVALPPCSTDPQPIAGKFTPAAEAQWRDSGVPNEVLLAIRREQELSPLPECLDRAASCPERDRYLARETEVAKASQTCVRSLIASIGGAATDEVFVPGNAMVATLSWSQIQIVAAHPDVISIAPRFDGTPPP
jgi:hypothetical protein